MASPTGRAADNSVVALDKFVSVVQYSLELYTDISKLLKYCFGESRYLVDVFTTAVSKPENVNICQALIRTLIQVVEEDLKEFLKKERQLGGKLGRTDENLLMVRIELCWELYKTRNVPSLIGEDDLIALERNMESIEKSIQQAGSERKSRLSPALRQHFNRGSPILQHKVILPLYRRSEVDLEVPKEEKPVFPSGPVNTFVYSYNEMLQKLTVQTYDFEEMTKVANQPILDNMKLPTTRVAELLEKLMKLWRPLLSFTDSRVRRAYLDMFHTFFTVTSTEDKKLIFDQVVSPNYLLKDELPAVEDDLEEFSEQLTSCLNQLGDHQDLQTNVERFEKVREKLLWFLFISPRTTLYRIFIKCIDNRNVVPAVLKVLHLGSRLFFTSVRSKMGGTEPMPSHILAKLFYEEKERWERFEMQESFVYFVASLCRRKRAVRKEKTENGETVEQVGDVLEDALLDGSDVFSYLLLPNLLCPQPVQKHQLMMLKIMHRFFQNLGAKDTEFTWTTELGENWLGQSKIPTAELFLLVHDFLLEWDQSCQPMSDACRQILKALGAKLKKDFVVFVPKTASFLLDHLSKDPWWLKYVIVQWFDISLDFPKQQLPSGLFLSLPVAARNDCVEIVSDFESSPVNCLLRSLFELALFDVDTAVKLLEEGLELRPVDNNLLEQIALALADCCGKSVKSCRVPNMLPFIDRIIKLLDPGVSTSSLEYLSESTFHGMRLVQNILLIAKATKIAFAKLSHSDPNQMSYYPTASLDKPGDARLVADELLQAFCELTKSHMETQMVSFRRSQYPEPPEIKDDRSFPDGVEMQRNESVLMQLTLLFNEAVLFTKLASQDVPASLRILIMQLSEHLREVQEKHKGRFLDSAICKSTDCKTVYAYAIPPPSLPANVSSSTSNSEVATHSATQTSNEADNEHSTSGSTLSVNNDSQPAAHFAENKLFEPKATAIVSPSPVSWQNNRKRDDHGPPATNHSHSYSSSRREEYSSSVYDDGYGRPRGYPARQEYSDNHQYIDQHSRASYHQPQMYGRRENYGNRDGQPEGYRNAQRQSDNYSNRDRQPENYRNTQRHSDNYGNRDGQPENYRNTQRHSDNYGNRDGQPGNYGNRSNPAEGCRTAPGGWRRDWTDPHTVHPAERQNYGNAQHYGTVGTYSNGVNVQYTDGMRHYSVGHDDHRRDEGRRDNWGQNQRGRHPEEERRYCEERMQPHYSSSSETFHAMANQIPEQMMQQQVTRRLSGCMSEGGRSGNNAPPPPYANGGGARSMNNSSPSGQSTRSHGSGGGRKGKNKKR